VIDVEEAAAEAFATSALAAGALEAGQICSRSQPQLVGVNGAGRSVGTEARSEKVIMS
jgi:hypothetical protein